MVGVVLIALGLATFGTPRCGTRAEPLVERVARIEHEQWMAWSKAVAAEVSPSRRARWKRYWVPYDQLPEDVKELDREWARKVIAEMERGPRAHDAPKPSRLLEYP